MMIMLKRRKTPQNEFAKQARHFTAVITFILLLPLLKCVKTFTSYILFAYKFFPLQKINHVERLEVEEHGKLLASVFSPKKDKMRKKDERTANIQLAPFCRLVWPALHVNTKTQVCMHTLKPKSLLIITINTTTYTILFLYTYACIYFWVVKTFLKFSLRLLEFSLFSSGFSC